MKRIILITCLSLLVAACKSTKETNGDSASTTVVVAPGNPVDYASTITADELKELLYVYASDEFEGRDTGEPGHDKAINFLKDFYVQAEVSGALDNGGYFQDVPLNHLYAPEVEVEVNGHSFPTYESIVSLDPGGSGAISAENVVYVGYGIDTENYTDYNNLDVQGKVVIAKAGEPENEDGT